MRKKNHNKKKNYNKVAIDFNLSETTIKRIKLIFLSLYNLPVMSY